MEVLREAPKTTSFIPLAEHQSTTPVSFYSGPPVLHYFSDRSKLIILEHEIQNAPAFAPLLEKTTATRSPSDGAETNGHAAEKVVEDVDVWVTSDKLFLYSSVASAGVSIPYPSISLHAIQSLPEPSPGELQGLYMQLVASSDESSAEDLEPESISVTIIPTASLPPATVAENGTAEEQEQPEQTPVVAMFTALSNCSNLHPDPVHPEEEEERGGGSRLFQAGLAFPGATDGGLPPAMPGSGGWITAENMSEFIDEEGNWIAGEEGAEPEEGDEGHESLGPGAGTVRTREGVGHQDGGGGGAEGEADETKWRRTS